jgi:hypothetical protein
MNIKIKGYVLGAPHPVLGESWYISDGDMHTWSDDIDTAEFYHSQSVAIQKADKIRKDYPTIQVIPATRNGRKIIDPFS